jgi:hypothetical protein
MFSDCDDVELLGFAITIGLLPDWLDDRVEPHHFDITADYREEALRYGAVEIERNECIQLVRKMNGLPPSSEHVLEQ